MALALNPLFSTSTHQVMLSVLRNPRTMKSTHFPSRQRNPMHPVGKNMLRVAQTNHSCRDRHMSRMRTASPFIES